MMPGNSEAAEAPEARRTLASELDKKVLQFRSDMRTNWLAMGRVLAEIQQTLAYRELGFANFQQYVEDRLGISGRWANYLLCMVRKAERFGIDAAELAKLDISKGLEIFRLNDGEQVKDLMNKSIRHGIPLKDLKREVAVALGLVGEDEPQTVRKLWHFSESQWSVISQAIQIVNLKSGSDSETYAVELLAAEYLAGVGIEVKACAESPGKHVPETAEPCGEEAGSSPAETRRKPPSP